MTIASWLKLSADALLNNNISTAHLDLRVLLSKVLNKPSSWVVAHQEHKLSHQELSTLNTYLQRRINQEPIAYILGEAEFYGRTYKVTKDTLQPRPETESMIELLKERLDALTAVQRDIQIIDIGTGSGCIAISAQLELQPYHPNIQVIATDISKDALTIARQNAEHLGANVTFVYGNLLEPIVNDQSSDTSDLIVLANLPYVPDDYPINASARHEPPIALFGGEDGLDLYRALFEQLSQLNNVNKMICVLTESLLSQHEALKNIAQIYGFVLGETRGLIQYFRTSE